MDCPQIIKENVAQLPNTLDGSNETDVVTESTYVVAIVYINPVLDGIDYL
jgi:hypothetical protein